MSVSEERSNANLKLCPSLLTLHPWTETQPFIWFCQVLIETDDWHESKTSSRHKLAEFSQATWKAVELFKQGLGSPSRVQRFQAITLKVYISVSRGPQPWHFRHLSCHRWVWSTLSCRKQSGLLIASLALLGLGVFMNELLGSVRRPLQQVVWRTSSCWTGLLVKLSENHPHRHLKVMLWRFWVESRTLAENVHKFTL